VWYGTTITSDPFTSDIFSSEGKTQLHVLVAGDDFPFGGYNLLIWTPLWKPGTQGTADEEFIAIQRGYYEMNYGLSSRQTMHLIFDITGMDFFFEVIQGTGGTISLSYALS
jgi:hypothetical protein